MTDVNIRVGLDVGGLLANSARGVSALKELERAMEEARKKGDYDLYGKLAYERNKLQTGMSGFQQDASAFTNSAKYQEYAAAVTAGNDISKFTEDRGFMERLKSLDESNKALEKALNGVREAAERGDFGQIQQANRDAGQEMGRFRQAAAGAPGAGQAGSLWAGNAVAAARGAPTIKELERAMEEARKSGDYGLYGKIAYERNKLQSGMSGFQRDASTFTNSAKYQEYAAAVTAGKDISKFTEDRGFMERLKSLDESNKALEKALNGVREAAERGDFGQMQQANTVAGQEMDRFRQAAAGAPGAGNAGLAAFLNVQTAQQIVQQIVGSVTGGINTYVAHLDRSSVINRQGGGDAMGAQIEGLHRSAAEKSQFWGSVGRIGGGILGTLAGVALAPFTGGASLMMAAGGAALGTTLFGAGGDLVGTLGDEKKANKMATKEAYAQQWQAQAPAAMELAGLLGRYGGSESENTRAIRDAFAKSAAAANEYGYSAQEGMAAVKQGASQGLSEGGRNRGGDKSLRLRAGDRGGQGRASGTGNQRAAFWHGQYNRRGVAGQSGERHVHRPIQRVFTRDAKDF